MKQITRKHPTRESQQHRRSLADLREEMLAVARGELKFADTETARQRAKTGRAIYTLTLDPP